MDKIDLEILKELNEDARKSFREIAKKLGLSNQTVINRYNEMKKKGTIQFCSVAIDLEKIGYTSSVQLLMNSSKGHNLSSVLEKLKKTKNILIVSKTIGDFEGYVILAFKNIQELYELILQIKSHEEIGKIELSFVVPGIRIFPGSRGLLH
ncbi:MAG: Lrp/AsnC family transcriptional regulator [Candidatus Bathyarchaeota archaeon]|nr:Lrp/AsnC family transcriptional regulator [Candidatus Bathyarchaeum sp.]